MLISSYKKGDTVTVKLSTGEELVGRFEEDTDKDVKLVKPTVITINPQNGQAMLIPWLISCDTTSSDPVSINKTQVIAISKPAKNLADGYLQSTTGIAPVSSLTGLK